MNIDDFSLAIQEIAEQKYSNIGPNEDNKYRFLIEHVYPNLCQYSEFQDVMNERRVKTTKQSNLNNSSVIGPGSQFIQNYSKVTTGHLLSGFANKSVSNINLYSLPDEELESSPFLTSFEKYKSAS